MQTRSVLTGLCLAALLAWPVPVRAVLTVTGTLTTATGDPAPSVTITLEREDEDRTGPPPVVVTTDQGGRFRTEVPPGVYTLRTTGTGARITDTVAGGDGETARIALGPPINPEYPGPGNLSLGVGYWGMAGRPLDLDGGTVTLEDGSRRPVESFFGRREYDLDVHVGFLQATYGLPRLGGVVGSGYLGVEASPYLRLGAGVATIDGKGEDSTFTKKSGASFFGGGGLNARITHTASPIYGLINLQGYYMSLGDVSGSGPGVQGASGDGSLSGFGIVVGAGAQVNRLAPGATGYLGMVNLYAGLGASWVFASTTLESVAETCVTRPGPPLGPFPDSPRGPDVTTCSASRVRTEKDLVEKSAVHGLLGLAFPIWGRDTGVIEASIGDGWWGLVVKFAKTFGL
jgi:hypothetical protein